MVHREEREFTLRLEVAREFAEDYDGDDDGFAWAQSEMPAVCAEIVRAAIDIAGKHGWRVHGKNRGRSSEDEVTLALEKS